MSRAVLGIAALLAVAAAALVLALALFGSENQLLAALKDDGFYFLALARNLAHGRGATFDGLGPTNGFHPLWLLLVTPIFWVDWGSIYTPVRALLLLSLALHLAAGAALYRVARLLVARRAAAMAALLYLANPLALYLVVSGMESPLVACAVLLLAFEAVRLRRGEVDPASWPDAVRLGGLAGLGMLARTDLALLAGLVLASALLPPRRDGMRRRVGLALRAALVALLVIGPWIAWNLARFGTLVQVSALAHNLHSVSLRAPDAPGGLGRLLAVGRSLLSAVFHSASARAGVPPAATAILLLGAVALAAWWLAAAIGPRASREELVARLRPIAAPLAYALGFLAAAFFLLGHMRSWYVAGPLAVGSLLLALPLDGALRAAPLPGRGRLASALLSAGVAGSFLALGPVFGLEILGNGRVLSAWRDATNWVVSHTEPDERIASFNSGTFGYLTPRTVVNLDCVVNNRALPWLERRRLVEFLERERIRFLVDDAWYVTRYFSYYGEADWKDRVVPIDTLPRGLIAWEVRPRGAGGRETVR